MLDQLLVSGQTEIQMIVFQLGKEEYAIPITCIQEIIMRQTITRIPKSPVFVEGVINLRGHIIPILDGRKKFQLKSKSNKNANDSRIMVLETEQEIIGLIVDSVSEVVHLNIQDIEPPPVDMGSDAEMLWGIGKLQDRLLILLDPKKLFSLTENMSTLNLNKVTEVIRLTKEMAKA